MTLANRQRGSRVNVRALERFARTLISAAPAPGSDSLGVCLVRDNVIRRLNVSYRGKDFATDVLAFPTGAGRSPDGRRHLGDIVISVPRAREQAREAGHSLGRELKTLLLHGYLHLLGYDHETDRGEMLRLQRRLESRLLPRRRESAR